MKWQSSPGAKVSGRLDLLNDVLEASAARSDLSRDDRFELVILTNPAYEAGKLLERKQSTASSSSSATSGRRLAEDDDAPATSGNEGDAYADAEG